MYSSLIFLIKIIGISDLDFKKASFTLMKENKKCALLVR